MSTQPKDTRPLALGPMVARLCRLVDKGDVIAVLEDERQAETVAAAAALLADALVIWLPPSDAHPGEAMHSTPRVAGRRNAALAAVQQRDGRRLLLVTDIAAAAQPIARPDSYTRALLRVSPGDTVDGAELAKTLDAAGYWADERVDEHGEYAVHGGTVDLFPPDADRPVRLHLENSSIDRITSFDPVTQRGHDEEIDAVQLISSREPETRDSTLFDHLPGARIAVVPDLIKRLRALLLLFEENPAGRVLSEDDWSALLADRAITELAHGDEAPGPRFVERKRPDRAVVSAVREARDAGARVLIAGSPRDLRFFARRLQQALGEVPQSVENWHEVDDAAPGSLLSAAVEFDRGWTEAGLMVVAAADVIGARALDHGQVSSANALALEAGELQIGDAIIHEDHGLGELAGIQRVKSGDFESDAIRLLFAGETQRLVPVQDAGRLWRYGAEAGAVSLDRLDGSSWANRRKDIDEALAETARQLVAMAAERAARTAPVLESPSAEYERFSAGFAFTETPDQLRAIAAVRDDLASGKPMDRLVVGDVGYGKTEVALRAAAVVALAGKQVALVAPTTVLVRQHIETFARRFRKLGIEVAGLSRLSSAAEARAVKAGLADGSLRIVVGTAKVAGKGVDFADLGLVIIDEEQRFGAAEKVKLRTLGQDVHVLTLTATPIPRTLQTALVGLQSLSLIATPPARRLPIRTHVTAFAHNPIRTALLREHQRGGQSFVVVPRIEDMEIMAERLGKLVPDLRIVQAHGKLPAAEIDEAMVDFAGGGADILLATNIIEAGLDIPRANTILVWRADRFGLAQLHQLRGRVGRGRVRGSMLLVTEEGVEIAPATLKRLRTLEALDQLGAGFSISARDLDLRGAGELLGEQQAGHSKLIGLDLYQHLLEQALRAARGEKVDDWMPDLHLGISAWLPETWIPEEEVRINLYVRLARAASAECVKAFAEELEDRFGTLPTEAACLIEVANVRQLARAVGIARIDAGPAAIALTLRPGGSIRDDRLEVKGERLLLRGSFEEDQARLTALRSLLESICPEA